MAAPTERLTRFAQGARVPRRAFASEAVDTVFADAVLTRVAGTLINICQKHCIEGSTYHGTQLCRGRITINQNNDCSVNLLTGFLFPGPQNAKTEDQHSLDSST